MKNKKKLNNIKSFESFKQIEENYETETKPDVKPPKTKPRTKPSPFRKVSKPNVKPRPKATAEDVAKRFMELKNKENK